MDFIRLQVFIHVAELESITKTANMLNTTQSAISRHVNALEREFGGRLFHRTGRGVRLSELGMRVEPRIRTVLAEIERIGAEAKAFAGVPTGEVLVGILPSLAPYISVALFGQVRRHFPEIRLRLVDGFSGQLEGQLVDGQLDMALLFRYSGRTTPTDELIAPLHSYLIGPKGDQLTETEKVNFADLKGIPLVVPTFPNGLRVALDEEARRHDFKLSIVLEVSSTPVQLAIVQEEREPVYAISSYYAAAEAIRLGQVQASLINSARVDRQLVLTMSERRSSSLATRTIKKAISDLSAALAALEPPMDSIETC